MLGGDNMVDVFVCLIYKKRRTFAQVPTGLQADVKADLEAMGLDENGNLIVVA